MKPRNSAAPFISCLPSAPFCNTELKVETLDSTVDHQNRSQMTGAVEKKPRSRTGGMLLGYARVYKGDAQNNALQARALSAAGCRKLFEEAAAGGRWDRPELHRMLDQLREGDAVVVWKLDRLSRSLKDVLHIMERIAAVGAGFRSVTEHINTTTPAGRMMVTARRGPPSRVEGAR